MAHRAAHPDRYPLREELKREQRAPPEEYSPTQVHLQVYDAVCHVLPLFSFTTPAKYCYRAIASFCKAHTTTTGSDASPVSAAGMQLPLEINSRHLDNNAKAQAGYVRDMPSVAEASATLSPTDNGLGASVMKMATRWRHRAAASADAKASAQPALSKSRLEELKRTIYTETQPFNVSLVCLGRFPQNGSYSVLLP